MARAARALGVVTLLVLAGCSGLSASSTPTLTPAAVPTDQPTTQRPANTSAVVGSWVDPLAVSTAHAQVLAPTSHAVVRRRTVRSASGTLRLERRARRLVDPDDRRSYERVAVRDPDRNADGPRVVQRWRDGGHILVAVTAGNRTRYVSPPTPGRAASRRRGYLTHQRGHGLYAVLGALDPKVVERTGDPPRIVLAATRTEPGPAFERLIEGTDPRNLSFRAVIEPSGLVRERSLQYRMVRDGRRVRVSSRIRYVAVGNVSIERPPWYDEAVAATRGN